jgi:hypothetical protein
MAFDVMYRIDIFTQRCSKHSSDNQLASNISDTKYLNF